MKLAPPTHQPRSADLKLDHLESTEAARAWLAMLRTSCADFPGHSDVDVLMRGLSRSIDRVLQEHRGMSEELIGAYEQLGVVFEVTRNLSSVEGEGEVLKLFEDSLRRSFAEAKVRILTVRQLADSASNGQAGVVEPGLREQVKSARETGKVAVHRGMHGANGVECSAGTLPIEPVTGEVMVAPVFAGQDFVGAIVLEQGSSEDAFRACDMLLVGALSTFCGDLLRSHRLVRELREMSLVMVRALVNAVDQKDEYTSGHSIRVGFFATLLGRRLGLSESDLQMLQWSALLHDVGKIGIRDDVLKKNARLTDSEFRHIKEHPVRSHKVVQQVPQLARALDGILHHHEHYDGSGYPSGLVGEAIPLQARIIQIADVFDALTSSRSYRPANEWRAALTILSAEAGKTVDPRLREIFDTLIREEIGSDPNGWESLLGRANCFAQDPSNHEGRSGDAKS